MGQNPDPKPILALARAYLSKGWCRGSMAWSASGTVSHLSKDAVAFCPLGAIGRAGFELGAKTVESQTPAIHAVRKVIGGGPLTEWNDGPGCTQEEVVAAFLMAEEALP